MTNRCNDSDDNDVDINNDIPINIKNYHLRHEKAYIDYKYDKKSQ